MRGKIVGTLLAVTGLVTAACSGGRGIPATAPTITTTVATTTTTTPPRTTATAAPPTTLDRLAEVQAIFEDLERRRLQALYDGDREAFSELFANEAYLEGSLGAFDVVEFTGPPADPIVRVEEILVDRPDCLAVRVFVDVRASLGPDAMGVTLEVLQPRQDERWGYAYAGTGWLCDGPHPLES